jgi:dTDP-4-dehydrorhamnose 3,5-epimerase
VGEFYTPGAEDGLRYDDPRLGIEWPLAVTDISEKDRAWPLLTDRQDLRLAGTPVPLEARR